MIFVKFSRQISSSLYVLPLLLTLCIKTTEKLFKIMSRDIITSQAHFPVNELSKK